MRAERAGARVSSFTLVRTCTWLLSVRTLAADRRDLGRPAESGRLARGSARASARGRRQRSNSLRQLPAPADTRQPLQRDDAVLASAKKTRRRASLSSLPSPVRGGGGGGDGGGDVQAFVLSLGAVSGAALAGSMPDLRSDHVDGGGRPKPQQGAGKQTQCVCTHHRVLCTWEGRVAWRVVGVA